MRKLRLKRKDYETACEIFKEMDLKIDTLETTPEDIRKRTPEELARFVLFFFWCIMNVKESSVNKETLDEMRYAIKEHVEIV